MTMKMTTMSDFDEDDNVKVFDCTACTPESVDDRLHFGHHRELCGSGGARGLLGGHGEDGGQERREARSAHDRRRD